MPGHSRKPSANGTPEPPGLLDEGPYLQLDQDLLGNQGVLEQTPGILDFDNPDPKLERMRRRVLPAGGLDQGGILERIASETDSVLPNGPGPAKKKKKPPSWINSEGLGGTVGDWTVGVRPTRSTSDDFDDPGTRDRAQRKVQDETAERQDPRVKAEE